MRFSKITLAVFLVVLSCGFSPQAFADAPSTSAASKCSNTQLRTQMTTAASNRAKQLQKTVTDNWKPPAAFNSLYCGANITSMFNQLGTNLGGAIFSMIQSLLTNLMNQACASAIAPIQNAASQLCIPFFSAAGFNINLGLSGTAANYCSGMQLLNVTPTMTPPPGVVPGFSVIPKLP